MSSNLQRTMRRNPTEEAYFQEEEDTQQSRINRFGQYAGKPSLIWLREVIQNGYDSGATEMTLTVHVNPDNSRLVTFVDNGTGMSRKILQEKFLKMGGTGKGERDSGTSMGGFGEAKKIILLAWKSWRVITKTAGSDQCTFADSENGGKKYLIGEDDASLISGESGTIVQILTWASDIYNIFPEHFRIMCGKCNLPNIDFKLDHRMAATQINALPKRNNIFKYSDPQSVDFIKADFSFNQNAKATVVDSKGRDAAKIYIRKGTGRFTQVFYRVKGLWLWDKAMSFERDGKSTSISVDVIVEFTVKTTTILTDNRDNIADSVLSDAIQSLLTNAIRDPRQFVRGFSKQAKFPYRGTEGALSADRSVRIEKAADVVMKSAIDGKISYKLAVEKIAENIEKNHEESKEVKYDNEVTKKVFEHAIRNIKLEGEPDRTAITNAVRMAIDSPDILLYIEEDLQVKAFEIHQKFKPGSMTAAPKEILSLWAEMCRTVFTIRGCTKTFGIGFVFSEETEGLCCPREPGLDADGFLLINPYSPSMTQRSEMIDIRNLRHVKEMWACCIHECTHMIDDARDHREEYAVKLTANIAHTANAWGLIKQITSIMTAKTPIAKDKFRRDLDVEGFLNDKLDSATKQKPDPRMEAYLADVARALSMRGGKVPMPEEFGVVLTPEMYSKIKDIASKSNDTISPVNEIIIKSLKAKVLTQEKELADLKRSIPDKKNEEIKNKPVWQISKEDLSKVIKIYRNPRGR